MSYIKGTTLFLSDMSLCVFVKFLIFISTFVGADALPIAKVQMYHIGLSERANTRCLRRTRDSLCLINDTCPINMNETSLNNTTVDARVLQSQRYKRWIREIEWKSRVVVL
jgi:hypothetical protein